MAKKHIPGIALLEKECFSEPWSEDGLTSELTNSQARFFVCEEEVEVLGYMGMHIVLDECYIANVAVYPHHRRKGIGEALVKYCSDIAEKENCCFITLEVRKSNLGAIALYEKNGFLTVGERKDFYSHPKENGLIMTKELR
ncbi:MAG: ribosomal protein S18-alanine N-acetyltransferase [Clostridia bacterium]|nr:ribosomal protein S18-alanine N-acetyltransferase [Clostridia bacterium]